MTGKDETVHLIGAYRHLSRSFSLGLARVTWRFPWEKMYRSAPEAACRFGVKRFRRVPDSQMVSIYDTPEDEAKITCQDCLQWLTVRRHRQMVTQGGVDEFIAESMGIAPVPEAEGSLLIRQLMDEEKEEDA